MQSLFNTDKLLAEGKCRIEVVTWQTINLLLIDDKKHLSMEFEQLGMLVLMMEKSPLLLQVLVKLQVQLHQ